MFPKALAQSRQHSRPGTTIWRKQIPPQKKGCGARGGRQSQRSPDINGGKSWEIGGGLVLKKPFSRGMEKQADLSAFLLVWGGFLKNSGTEGTLNMQGCKALRYHADSQHKIAKASLTLSWGNVPTRSTWGQSQKWGGWFCSPHQQPLPSTALAKACSTNPALSSPCSQHCPPEGRQQAGLEGKPVFLSAIATGCWGPTTGDSSSGTTPRITLLHPLSLKKGFTQSHLRAWSTGNKPQG